MNHDHFLVPPDKKVKLKDYDTAYTGKFKNKSEATEKLQSDIQRLAKLQDVLYAQNTYALLIIFQAMDAAGKDGTIRHVMSGVNPQGCQVYCFQGPSAEELDHDLSLAHVSRRCPSAGASASSTARTTKRCSSSASTRRSSRASSCPPRRTRARTSGSTASRRSTTSSSYLSRNGTTYLKFFLNVSKDEQKRRFLERIDTPGEELEVLRRRRSRSATSGTTTWTPTRTLSRTPAPSGRRGTSCPPTTSGSRAPRSPMSSSPNSSRSISVIPRSARST